MESINNNKVKYRFLVFILAFMVAIAPLGNIKKVEALSPSDLKLVSPFIIGLILTSLVASGAVSGGYQVSPTDLSSIAEKAQANLQAAGSTAVEQANRLGEAIKSGAESAKIKALASGAVIYAFLQAIQDTLFPDKTTDRTWTLSKNEVILSDFGDYVVTKFVTDSYVQLGIPNRPWFLSTNIFVTGTMYVNDDTTHDGNWGPAGYLQYRRSIDGYIKNTATFYCMTEKPSARYSISIGHNSDPVWNYFGSALGIQKFIDQLSGNAILDNDVTHIASTPSVSLPTRLPTTIINNINNWDGTSDLVLAPPLPYDIPDDEALVIDPTYEGADVIDPPIPDNPDEEGSITLPWLSALLALLGLGNPSLDGIEAGVKTAIDTIIDGITATAQDVFDGTQAKIDAITGALSGIDATVQTGIDAITGAISVPLTGISDFVLSVPDFFAIPEGKSIATPIIEQIPQVFPIVDQMNTALNKITVETRPLIIYYPYLDGSTKQITLDWYEPAREQVKHGVGLLFKVVTALACFAMVSNVFGIGIRVGTGQAYTDNNSGGSSGNSRKKED